MIVLPKDSSKDLNADVHAYICIFYILHFDSYIHSCYSTSKAKIQTELFALKVRLAPECYLLPLANKKNLTMFEPEKVTKQYGRTIVLHETTLTVNDGEFFVLVDTGGSGKTTLLKLLNRLI